MIDGFLLQAPPPRVYQAGNAAAVPFMAGANTADIGFAPPAEGDLFEARFGPLAEQARGAYAEIAGDTRALETAIAADAGMVEPARYMVQAMSRAGQPAWHYRAGYVPQVMRDEWPGLPHATEISFFFKTVEARYPGETTPEDLWMAETMSAFFVNFAKAGDPNAAGLPAWPIYDDESRPVMLFGMTEARGGEDPWRARLDVTEAASNARDSASDR